MPLANHLYGTLGGKKISADFSQLVWYGQKTEELRKILSKVWDRTKVHPFYNANNLKKLIARHHELPPENFLLTNGSAEAIYLIAYAYKSPQTTIAIPTRKEYEVACKNNRHYLNFVLTSQLARHKNLPGGLAFICNPDNFTGETLDKTLIRDLLHTNPNTIIVVDQSYMNYVPEAQRLNNLLHEYSNLIILESISQSFSLPGLPLGYIAGNEKILQKISLQKAPHSLNSLTIEAARYILTHKSQFQIPLKKFLHERDIFINKLNEIPSVEAHQSNAPYFLLEILHGSPDELVTYLWNYYTVIVRDVSNYRGINKNFFRLIPRENQENFLLLRALKNWDKNK